MKFTRPLVPAILERRYKRFLADIILQDGSAVTAHVANPGSMLGMNARGLKVWVEPNDDPKRKLNYSWKLAELENGTLIGVDTAMPNKIIKEALANKAIPELVFDHVKAEVKYGENSRVDLLLTTDGEPDHYLEVKSVTLSRKSGIAEFPDSVTARGAKHMGELANMVANGHRATILYLVQRDDAASFRVAGDIDPTYFAAYEQALSAGVDLLVYDTVLSPNEVFIGKRLPLASGRFSV
ncbi:sugar fermentation stimulation protein SfsA [Amylibacter kogurei]|uniref:Sugar fermentation stimulation protein homolog n=1 Tax=Paramylibacter kogurei TaxID=1889778 RepID=A0A2G5KAJ6_9RHOB|nr:DNA/RNA nuclease SfsA [Amylibacter kogurei]PIB26546.1 sugar fermentation stimulation protein SfsA [Amylibacter kogurei]